VNLIDTCRLMCMEPDRARRYVRYARMQQHRERVRAANDPPRTWRTTYRVAVDTRAVSEDGTVIEVQEPTS